MRSSRWIWVSIVCGLAVPTASVAAESQADLELVETYPVETSLDVAALRSAHLVWIEMIQAARKTIDIAQFYVSPKEDGTGRLTPVLDALKKASERGVRVRLMADAKFARKYPKPLEDLNSIAGIEVRKLNLKSVTGGVLHAKYFVVDGASFYLGSQNFDWRSLEHIQELGVRVRSQVLAKDMMKIFEEDWRRAGGESVADGTTTMRDSASDTLSFEQKQAIVQVVATPKRLLPSGVGYEFGAMTQALKGARESVQLQLLSYAVKGYDGSLWREMDSLLRAAAQRGVKVEILLADWSKKPPKVEAIQSLAAAENIRVKFVTIPAWSGGHIPYARVVHSKYMVVDGAWSWVGSSNFSGDYFTKSRNVGIVARGSAFNTSLRSLFRTLWLSSLAELVDPQADYLPPQVR